MPYCHCVDMHSFGRLLMACKCTQLTRATVLFPLQIRLGNPAEPNGLKQPLRNELDNSRLRWRSPHLQTTRPGHLAARLLRTVT